MGIRPAWAYGAADAEGVGPEYGKNLRRGSQDNADLCLSPAAGARQGLGSLADGGEAWFDVVLHRTEALVPGLGHDDVVRSSGTPYTASSVTSG